MSSAAAKRPNYAAQCWYSPDPQASQVPAPPPQPSRPPARPPHLALRPQVGAGGAHVGLNLLARLAVLEAGHKGNYHHLAHRAVKGGDGLRGRGCGVGNGRRRMVGGPGRKSMGAAPASSAGLD